MDVVVQLFQKHVSPEKLQEYRLAWTSITNTIVVSLIKSTSDIKSSELNSIISAINQSSFSKIKTNHSKNVTTLHETNLPTVTLNVSSQGLDKSISNVEGKIIIETALNNSPISSKALPEIEKVTKLQETKLSTVASAYVNASTQDLNEPFLSNEVEVLASGSNVEGEIISAINQSFFSKIKTNHSKNVTTLHETNLPTVTSNVSSQGLDKSISNVEGKIIIETALNDSPILSKALPEIKKLTKLQETKLSTVASAYVNASTQDLNEPFLSNEVEILASGSNVEGANLARLFFQDNQNEIELDIMYQVAQINRMCLEQCEKSNPMFVHILLEMDSDVINECEGTCGEKFHKFFICNNENSKQYFSSNVLKSDAKDSFDKFPYLLKHLGGYTPCTDHPDWKSKDAAGTLNIIFSNDREFKGERESNPQETAKHVINKVVNNSVEFEQKAKSMLQTLIQVQHSFLESRLYGKTKVEQINLAIEYLNQCLCLTDTLCDHRQETIGYTLRQCMGFKTNEVIESMRTNISQNFENHLSKLNKHLNYPNLDEAEQALLDFETNVKSQQYIICLNTFLEQELLFMNIVSFAQKEAEDPKYNNNELLNFSEKNVSKISIDFVFCLKCNFWPEVAAEWPKRERLWPEQATIKNIVANGIHVVCKELQHSAIDWRLSFSVAEIEIAKLWTTWQHYIYFIFKSLFYKYLKPLSNKGIKVITSYLVKTVMLNVSENFDQSWWREENAGECLNVLLMTLISAFESRILPHHFVPSFNLLKGVSSDGEAEQVLDAKELYSRC
ncbi:uncharacterized protein LOC105844242 isoform X1 [Hydra vulgaris]|uniref:uncharacterized protein LOC105844242 isoform X1 n=1 Tax=Hydra vulgaris TaxID=6087 RepID=UPI001F5E76CE|nr:uncharacterized protein LOC105844242 [Hydra vulgaris]